MKREICLLIAVLSLLSSCATQRWCNNHYPQIADTVIKEVVRDSIIVKDTTITITLPGETEIDSIPIPCPPPPPGYVPRRVYAETSLARASAWWDYPNIRLELIQKDTTIERKLENAIMEAYHWRTEYKKITVTPAPVKFIPGIYKVAFWLWIGVIVAALGYVAIRIFVLKK